MVLSYHHCTIMFLLMMYQYCDDIVRKRGNRDGATRSWRKTLSGNKKCATCPLWIHWNEIGIKPHLLANTWTKKYIMGLWDSVDVYCRINMHNFTWHIIVLHIIFICEVVIVFMRRLIEVFDTWQLLIYKYWDVTIILCI